VPPKGWWGRNVKVFVPTEAQVIYYGIRNNHEFLYPIGDVLALGILEENEGYTVVGYTAVGYVSRLGLLHRLRNAAFRHTDKGRLVPSC